MAINALPKQALHVSVGAIDLAAERRRQIQEWLSDQLQEMGKRGEARLNRRRKGHTRSNRHTAARKAG